MITVLSLFDGIACGAEALRRLRVPVKWYLAAEIDTYAMRIGKKNHPDIIHIGDIKNIKPHAMPYIDLILGGSPCQGFSRAGRSLNFEDPRSRLFFDFVHILKGVKHRYFLFENVIMRQEWQDVISDYLGVQPIRINSALVSAQNRDRLYWTNIPTITQPANEYIQLQDILEDGFTDRTKAYCIDANYAKDVSLKYYLTKSRRQVVFRLKSQAILATIYKENAKSMFRRRKLGLLVGDLDKWCNIKVRKLTPLECERLQTLPDKYTEGVSNTQRYKMLGNAWTVDVIKHILSFAKWI